MKQKDVVLIIVIAFVSGVFALLVSRWLFASPKNSQQTAEVVDVVTSEFPELPTKYYNERSINPTQLIEIGNATNPNPFNTQP